MYGYVRAEIRGTIYLPIQCVIEPRDQKTNNKTTDEMHGNDPKKSGPRVCKAGMQTADRLYRLVKESGDKRNPHNDKPHSRGKNTKRQPQNFRI